MMNKLSPCSIEVLQRICAAYADRAFPVEKAEQLRPEALCRAELQLVVQELRRAGLLELRQRIWGEQLYQIPPQQLAAIQQECFSFRPEPLFGSSVAATRPAEAGLAAQLFRALVFMREEGLPLTAKGGIHKKHSGRLAGLLPVQDKHLYCLVPKASADETGSIKVTVLLDIMLALGLAERGETAYRLAEEKVKSWLDHSELQMTGILYNMILSRYAAAEPAQQHFRYLLTSGAFIRGSWYVLDDILELLQQSGLSADHNAESLKPGCLAWLHCMAGFGWCETGTADNGEDCFRWMMDKPVLPARQQDTDARHSAAADLPEDGHDTGRAGGGFIVQPDLEVLVPPDVSYRLRWGLAGCAELLSTDDGLWSFRLSRGKLEAAAERGLPPEAVTGWLAGHAAGGLPDQVRQSLVQWSRTIGRTSWSEVLLLTCQGNRDADDIAAHPRLGDSLTRIGPLHFIVQQGSADLVRRELTAAGLAPPRLSGGSVPGDALQPFELPDDDVPAQSEAYDLPALEMTRGLLGNTAVLRTVPLAAAEAVEALLPGADGVPQMWLRESREYHITTAQKVMEQAYRWGVKVRLSVEGQSCDFIPEQLRGNPWRAAGWLMPAGTNQYEAAELAPGDWKEMKLLLPEQHRNSSSA
ncbi:hypothetical protein D3C75_381000 [compost metagenome]